MTALLISNPVSTSASAPGLAPPRFPCLLCTSRLRWSLAGVSPPPPWHSPHPWHRWLPWWWFQ